MPVDPNIDPPVLARHNGYDVYPMPMFVRMEVRDLAATARWYCEALDFGVMFETPGMAHLRRKKFQDLLIFQATFSGPVDAGLALSFEAQDEVDAIFDRASKAAVVGQARLSSPPTVTPWNARELHLTDPEGRRLVFHEQARNDPAAEDRMRAMFKDRSS